MDESRIIIEFDYRPQRVKLIAVTLLATAGVALLTYGALTLGGPIDIKGFRLTRRQGRMFFGMDHQDGVTCIPSNMIADSNRFVQLCELIREAVSNNRPRKLAEQLHQGITKSPS